MSNYWLFLLIAIYLLPLFENIYNVFLIVVFSVLSATELTYGCYVLLNYINMKYIWCYLGILILGLPVIAGVIANKLKKDIV